MPNPAAPRYDTLSARFIAGIIDGFVLLPVGIIDEIIFGMQFRWLSMMWLPITYSAAWLYYVIGHCVYGKTVGKHVMKLSVVDVETEERISWTQSLLRESVYIALNLYALSLSLYAMYYEITESSTALTIAAYIILFGSFAWFVVEVISAMTNEKRRAVHDLIAGTVVVKQAAVEE